MKVYKLFFPLLIFICACTGSTDHPEDISLDITPYFVEHTDQHISVKGGMAFRFKEAYAYDGDGPISGVKIVPHVDGKWQWPNRTTLTFTPAAPLDYDEEYMVYMNLDQLLEKESIPNTPAVFSIHTRPLAFSIDLHGLKMQKVNGSNSISYKGEIVSSDFAKSDVIESLLDYSQEGNNLKAEWIHSRDGQRHQFVINDIMQEDSESVTMDIAWDGGKWDKNFEGKESVVIAGKLELELNDIKLSASPERIIRIHFNSHIDTKQNLKGLISINGNADNIRTDIDGNILIIYPSGDLKEEFELFISSKIKNEEQVALGTEHRHKLQFNYIKPTVRMIGAGIIMPHTAESYLPLEVVNLTHLDIEIFKIFENNVLQHLQGYNLNAEYVMNEVGRIVHRETINVSNLQGTQSHNKWMRIGLNLKEYIDTDPAAIYQVRVGFQKAYAITDCDKAPNEIILTREGEESMTTYTDEYYSEYENRDNPCHNAFYNPNRFVKRNVMNSDVGVISKKGRNGHYHFAISSISEAQPIGGARVQLYDFQKQEVGEGVSNGDGFLDIETSRNAAYAIVQDPKGYAYVKLDDQNSNSLTDFDISGVDIASDVNGYIYTDRGVYRPGDTIHMNFILEDAASPLPHQHPVSLTVTDPKRNKKYSITTSSHIEKIYAFHIPTEANNLTGHWSADIKVGAHTFSKKFRVETIKPNRLKIEIDAPKEVRTYQSNSNNIMVQSRWLHGASASGLKAKMEASYRNITPKYKGLEDYSFMDPARQGSSGISQLLDAQLDDDGRAKANIKIKPTSFPGKVKADIKTRVFENGGNFSENYASLDISPFESYVGVKSPENRWGYNSVQIGENGTFKVVSMGDDGQPVKNRKLTVGIYNINWRWWYYHSNRHNIYRLNSAEHKEAFYKNEVATGADGTLDLTVNFDDVDYGRKLIRICDEVSGHCTGQFFYARGWGASSQSEERENLAKLNFKSDKKEYNVGDEVTLHIPSEKNSRILVSVESGSDVLFQDWINGIEGETEYQFRTKDEMAPNVYAHVMMVQSYEDKQNDLPIRMYGVIPIKVKDPLSILSPVLDMEDKLEPKEKFQLEVSEEEGKAMAYTIAIVDEGLLDLTNFSTPSPHGHFFAKQSLGVKTWDLYSHVMTGISGAVDRIISVGGDDEGGGNGGAKRAIRFKPVVMTAGPFYLNAGEKSNHEFVMPNYIGSVRAMVVARKDKSFGSSDMTVPVKKPIMILPTMPRVLGPGELVSIPVSVFANEDNIKNVNVTIESTPNLEMISDVSQRVSFSKTGEKLVYFKARVKDELGIAKVKVKASSGNISIDQDIQLDIRNPNPYESKVYDHVINPGESWVTSIETFGMNGTNEGILELSAIPPINLDSRLDYLIRYPYGCIEQTTSSAFPQISLDEIIEVDADRERKITRNVDAAIKRLGKMQRPNGGFSYWPGQRSVNSWGTNYAGHFITVAREKGYYVPINMISSWIKYQSQTAKKYSRDRSTNLRSQQRLMLDHAYRLYTLALVGSPEMTAMNVLRQEDGLSNTAKYILAAAYGHAGKQNIALSLVKNTSTDVDEYNELSYTYGSDLRDMAMIAQALMTLDRTRDAGALVKKIANRLNSGQWYSTQTLAQSLLTISDYISEFERDDMNFEFEVLGSGKQTVVYKKPVYLYSFDPDKTDHKDATVTNLSKDVLFARVVMSGQRPASSILSSKPYNHNITMSVSYRDLKGNEIDPSVLERGTDFMAHVQIKNQNVRGKILEEMALSQIFPSGWEIQSGGLSNISEAVKEDTYEYRDVRDDRVYTFFDLGSHKDFKIMLTAAYDGEYFLPPVSCEAMYDNEIQSRSKGMKVKVVPPEIQ